MTMNNQIAEQLDGIALRRAWWKLNVVLKNMYKPSKFFYQLKEKGDLSKEFPEIYALIGQTHDPKYHPDGDAFEHTMKVLDDVSEVTKDVAVRFAALYHDIGKGVTPKELLPKHHGHDKTGVSIIENLPGFVNKRYKEVAMFVAEHHMRIHTMKKPGAIRDLMTGMVDYSITAEMINPILVADHGSAPEWMNDDAINMVIGEVSVPEDIPIERISEYIRTEQIKRVRSIMKG